MRFILDHAGVKQVSLVAHSWGTMAAGLFAGHHPALVDRIVFFAPIARRPPRRFETPPRLPTWRLISAEDQWARFVEDVPPTAVPVLPRGAYPVSQGRERRVPGRGTDEIARQQGRR